MAGFMIAAVLIIFVLTIWSTSINSMAPLLVGSTILGLIGVLVFIGTRNELKAAAESKRKALEDLNQKVSEQGGFKASQSFVSIDLSSAVGIDEKMQRIALASTEAEPKIFAYKDIYSVEVIEDGETVTRTSRSSQVLGAAVGGALLGGVGMIIGGLSGETTTSNTVTSVGLKIVVNDTGEPLWQFGFFEKRQGASKNSDEYKEASRLTNHWHALISVLIKQAEKEDDVSYATVSLADELGKWVALLEKGNITQEEFEAQKAKLLGA